MSSERIFTTMRVAVGRICQCDQTRTRIHVRNKTINSINRRFSSSQPARQFQKWTTKLNEQLTVLAELFAQQCNVIAAQRVRRATQITELYKKLYGDNVLKVFSRLGNAILKNLRKNRISVLFGATLFSWERERVTEGELKRCMDDMESVKDHGMRDNREWESVIDKAHLKLWRKPVENSYLYEYKVYGTFFDIPARAFFQVQADLDYRKQWDKHVIKLDIIDREDESGSEVVHWVTHFPYPMYSRDYVYVRKSTIDTQRNVMALSSRAVEHPLCPIDPEYVRVTKYSSQMVIKPHSSFDESGLDYILTYYDDPQAAYPSIAYNWMASTGVPDFVDKLHNAAKDLLKKNVVPKANSRENNTQSNYKRTISNVC